jgi:hypothetical protein
MLAREVVRHMNRKRFLALATALTSIVVIASMPRPVAAAEDGPYTVAIIGDYNYGPLDGPLWAESERMIKDINAANVAFTIHNGDIKAGSTECTDDIVTATKKQFDSFTSPLVYQFGDNEWTDCHRFGRANPTSRFGDPIERLDNLRRVFYSRPLSQGAKPMPLTRQADVDTQFPSFVENVRWQRGPVTYVGIDVPGSNNNAPGGPLQTTKVPSNFEWRIREAAVLSWLDQSVAAAVTAKSKVLFISLQANPDFENRNPDLPTYDNDGYKRLIATFQRIAVTFPGKVFITHGDSHQGFKLNSPITDVIDVRSPFEVGKPIASFTRVETFGNPNTHWVKMTVDPKSTDVVTFEAKIVPGNPVTKTS